MKLASIIALVACLIFSFALPAYAVKLVEEEEIYQGNVRETRKAGVERETKPGKQNVPANTIKTAPPVSAGNGKIKKDEKKAPQSRVGKNNSDDTGGQPYGSMWTRVRDWIMPTSSGIWGRVWNWIILLIGVFVFVKLAAEITIRMR